MDELDAVIIEEIYKIRPDSYVRVPELRQKLIDDNINISEMELGDRLDILEQNGYIKCVRGSYAPGMSLRNGINNLKLEAKARMFLLNKK